MRTQTIFVLMLMVLAFSLLNAQDLPPKHRGTYPRLMDNGKVMDMNGNLLGFITKAGKVCDVTGKVMGIIAATGEVSFANGKGIIGVFQNDTLKTKFGNVVTTDSDGLVKVSGKVVAFVDRGYSDQSHGCVLHCFFSRENRNAKEIDQIEQDQTLNQ